MRRRTPRQSELRNYWIHHLYNDKAYSPIPAAGNEIRSGQNCTLGYPQICRRANKTQSQTLILSKLSVNRDIYYGGNVSAIVLRHLCHAHKQSGLLPIVKTYESKFGWRKNCLWNIRLQIRKKFREEALQVSCECHNILNSAVFSSNFGGAEVLILTAKRKS